MEMRMDRVGMVTLGLLVLGVIILGAGAGITTGPATTGYSPVNDTGQSLIAIGLSFLLVGIGLFLAWAAPQPS